ncbi:bile acid:sodium symporter family protein [[Leptolyngbya] sp. PCC 7376]|uniref:bile acid:sodium symporter family protein n=1 Tax=[Leptolyngbya] sp. PCC 7376 TaxID=111781 RepID=UPI0021F841EC|nr:bile acid:sodium symporter family protein [[Leptolyngbya] sp. PCC 7376]
MFEKILQRLTNAFPAWVLSASILAMFFPELFTWFTGPWITYGLGIIMLGMGLTLKLEDFKGVSKYPLWIGTGVLLQYTIMPLLGWALGYVFQLPTPLAAGLVLVACCPGGTASNVISFLARANVALSVTMTAVSTLLAAIMTPTLTALLVGSRLEVSVLGLFLGTVKVVLLPVALGVILNHYLPKVTKQILPYSPLVAVLVITLIVASVIGASREKLIESGFQLLGQFGHYIYWASD